MVRCEKKYKTIKFFFTLCYRNGSFQFSFGRKKGLGLLGVNEVSQFHEYILYSKFRFIIIVRFQIFSTGKNGLIRHQCHTYSTLV